MKLDVINVDNVVIGGGIIGLSVARQCVQNGCSVVLIEKNPIFLNETSSRNSEVIHAGIYYPKNSLKARLCVKGREMLYRYLSDRRIQHKKIGKMIFASNDMQANALDKLYQNGIKNGVTLSRVPTSKKNKFHDFCQITEAIFSPDTGILNSHQFSECLIKEISDGDGFLLNDTSAKIIDTSNNKLTLQVSQKNSKFILKTKKLFNCAGHGALAFLKNAQVDIREFTNFPVKGHYFSYLGNYRPEHLLYPMPQVNGLGVHLTLDLNGNVRFGPDTQETHLNFDYKQTVDSTNFYEAVKENFPNIEQKNLSFTYAGVRPKIKYKGELMNDFIIKSDFSGKMVSLLGIESPGLTASLAVAEFACGELEYNNNLLGYSNEANVYAN